MRNHVPSAAHYASHWLIQNKRASLARTFGGGGYAVLHNQVPVVRRYHRRGFRSGEAQPDAGCAYCLAASGILVRHPLALA
jgi:hypothetical protein